MPKSLPLHHSTDSGNVLLLPLNITSFYKNTFLKATLQYNIEFL